VRALVSNRQLATSLKLAGFLAVTLLFSGCFDSNSGTTPATADVSPPAAGAPQPPVGNLPPVTLEGTPPTSVTIGSTYSFEPTVSASSTVVTFKITGQPAWARFDMSNGALSGTPSTLDEGSTGHIVITASNATSTASLTPFTIQVKPARTGSASATVSWKAPTENTDGSPVTDLAGYHILYGPSPSELTSTVTVAGAASTTYEIGGLAEGTYYFAVVAYNSAGFESGQSDITNQSI
jgi:Fibronectin type III domain